MSQSPIDAAALLSMALKIQTCPLPESASSKEHEDWLMAEFGNVKFRQVEYALKLCDVAEAMCCVLK